MQLLSLCTKTGEKADCSNYHTLHCRQNLGLHLAEQAHPNNSKGKYARKQVWVQSDRVTADMMFVLRQIQGKRREQNRGLYICSFHRPDQGLGYVSCNGPWKILMRLGCPPKFLILLHQLHEGKEGQVKYNG